MNDEMEGVTVRSGQKEISRRRESERPQDRNDRKDNSEKGVCRLRRFYYCSCPKEWLQIWRVTQADEPQRTMAGHDAFGKRCQTVAGLGLVLQVAVLNWLRYSLL